MLKIVAKPIIKIFSGLGYNIVKKQNSFATHVHDNWLSRLAIDTIIDVGANEGQFIKHINEILPGKKIIAFEPIKTCYESLIANTRGINVTAYNCGLSDQEGSTEINISQNFVSSSILPLDKQTENLYPDAKYVNKQTIELKRLDDVMKSLKISGNTLVKIDVQGYEDKVIAGGAETIKAAKAIIIESSYKPLYEGQWLFGETYDYFAAAGFRFMGVIDQARSKETSIPIYGDAIFIKKELCSKVF